MTTRLNYPSARSRIHGDVTLEDYNHLVDIINNILNGKLNSTGSVVLNANEDTTEVLDPRSGIFSKIILVPRTSEAAAEGAYIFELHNGRFVIGHNNSADEDRVFDYVVVG